MAIFRKEKNRENPYVMVDKEWINSPNLSSKAKGILLYLLSKPDDWLVYEKDIVNHMRDGRDSIRSGIKELIKYGYITRTKVRAEKGKFSGYDYIVSEKPQVNRSGFSNNGKPDIGESNTTNNDLTNKRINKDNYTDDLRPSESLWVNELPENEFPFCIEAMKEIISLKRLGGHSNLYDGPLPRKDWTTAEKRLSVAEFELYELRDRIYDIYKNRYQHSKKHQAANSINLCYLVHGYDETDDGTRLLHIIQEGKDEVDIF